MARTIEALLAEYVSEKMEHLVTESKCCVNLFGPYRRLELVLIDKISSLGLKSRIHMINGFEVLKIYKLSCSHNIHQPSKLQLTKKSQKNILYHLKNTEQNLFQQEMYISPQIFRPSKQEPHLPPNRFSIGSARHSIYQKNTVDDEAEFRSWKIYPFKETILQKVNQAQVLVINGDVSLEKSTAVPMFIVDESIAKGTYCKILCVEADNLSAITHSTILTNRIKERIGSRVGFQVHLQSRVCDGTNLIYTTTAFFLRVLMGQSPQDSFRHISHIVVSNVHLHHAYNDILLCELKNALHCYPQMKVVLLSDSRDNTDFLLYFEKSEELRLQLNTHGVEIHFMEEIKSIIESNSNQLQPVHDVRNILPLNILPESICLEGVDKVLEEYAATGRDSKLRRFLHFVHSENISVDYCHSKFGYTALILAAKHGNYEHARLLTCENADPLIQDGRKISALEYAISSSNVKLGRAMLKYAGDCELKPPPIDFPLISQLIQLLTTNWTFGHILVFLPTYEDILKLNYAVLKLRFAGKIAQETSVHLLHSNMQYNDLVPIISESPSMKIVLATKVAESLTYLNDITYVIDCGQESFEKYDAQHKCKMTTTEWASTESLQRRALVASRIRRGHCFRLMPRHFTTELCSVTPPELLYMSTDRMALIVKFLCPFKSVAEYFEGVIVQPPVEHVRHSTQYLKEIEVFDCMEEVTWLACRLIDVPMDFELGKALVLSILLKCLDPVLTIVSFLTATNSSERTLCQSYTQKHEEIHFDDEGLLSDHLTLLRLYQIWQNEKRENIVNDVLSNEATFVVNGILDKICGIRTYLVGALRSSQLIHNQGQLSMHSINSKANNWAVIKAALGGGLYPNLCLVDRQGDFLKLKGQELCIHPISSVHTSKCALCKPAPSDWIVFFGESNNGAVNSTSNCTLINPTTAFLIGGRSEMDPQNIVFPKLGEHTNVFVDEWMWLTTDVKSAVLLFCLRQKFHMAYMDFLQTCGSNDKWRKHNRPACETYNICDLLSKVLLEEDVSAGFVQPIQVGNRPKAMANKFTSDFEIGSHPLGRQIEVDVARSPSVQKKEFFLVGVFDKDENMKTIWKQPGLDISREPFFASICNSVCAQKMTYVIVCNLNRKRITNVAVVKTKNDGYFLQNRFHVDIPVCDVIIVCKVYKLQLPSFSTNRIPVKLEKNVGELILDFL